MDTQTSLQQNLDAVKRLSNSFKKFVGSAAPLLDKLTQISALASASQSEANATYSRDFIQVTPDAAASFGVIESLSPSVASAFQGETRLQTLTALLQNAFQARSSFVPPADLTAQSTATIAAPRSATDARSPKAVVNSTVNTAPNTPALSNASSNTSLSAITPVHLTVPATHPGAEQAHNNQPQSEQHSVNVNLPQLQTAIQSFAELQHIVSQVEATLGVSITADIAALAQNALPFIGQIEAWSQQNPLLAQGLKEVAAGLLNNVPLMDALAPLAQNLADVPVVKQVTDWAQQNPVLVQSLSDVTQGIINNASVMDTLGPVLNRIINLPDIAPTLAPIVAQTQQWAQDNPVLAQGLKEVAFGLLENSKLMSLINPLMGTFADVPILGNITRWAQKNPELTQSIQALSGGLTENMSVVERLSPLMDVFSLLGEKSALGFSKMAQWASPLIGVIGRMTSVFTGMNVAMLANPIVLIVAGIVALIAVIGLLIYKYFEPLKAFFADLWDGFLEGLAPFMAAFEPIKTLFASLGELFMSFSDLIYSTIGGAFDFVVGKVKALIDTVANIGGKVIQFFSGLFGGNAEINLEPVTSHSARTLEANALSSQVTQHVQDNAAYVAGAQTTPSTGTNVFARGSNLTVPSNQRSVSVGEVKINVNATGEQSSLDIAEKVKIMFENMLIDMQRDQRGVLFDG